MSEESQPPPQRPPKEDPWEARERQRERWRTGGSQRSSESRKPQSNRSSGSQSQASNAADSGFKEDIVAWGLIAAIAVLLCSETPTIAAPERETLARIGSATILLLIGITREFQERLPPVFRRGPNPCIVLLFAWSIFEFFHSPFRGYATTELMRVFDGVGAYFLCAYCLKSPRQTGLMAAGLLFLGAVVALLNIAHVGGGEGNGAAGVNLSYNILGTHENVGSFFMLLFPVALAFAVSPAVEEKRNLSAIAASLVIGAGLLIARPRAAWIGSLCGLIVFAVLSFRYLNSRSSSSGSERRAPSWRLRLASLLGSPLFLITVAVILFLVIAGAAPLVTGRLGTLRSFRSDVSFTGRVSVWAGAARMVAEEPLIGRGLGSFQVVQGRWTHFGTEIERALARGVGDENMAHNYYLQWAADTGGIGLFLYLSTLLVFLFTGFRAVPHVTLPMQRALLCGSLAAVVAGAVDAVASPAYYFHGISTLYWCIIGLGVASMRPTGTRSSAKAKVGEPASGPAPLLLWLSAAAASAILLIAVVQIGSSIQKAGLLAPRGRLELSLQAIKGPAYPGETLHWTAFYHDANGVDRSTMPGTIWHLTSTDPTTLPNAKITIDEYSPVVWVVRHEVMNVVAPSMNGTLTMHARFADQYGRWYDAYSMQDVSKNKPEQPTRSK